MAEQITSQTLESGDNRHESSGSPSCIRQSVFLFRLLLRLKAWRFALLLLMIVPLLSNMYIPQLLSAKKWTRYNNNNLKMCSSRRFAWLKHRVLVSKSDYRVEFYKLLNALNPRRAAQKMKSVFVDCNVKYSLTECDNMFINQASERREKIEFYIRFNKSVDKPTRVICEKQAGSDLKCAFLYQMVSQYLSSRLVPSDMFKLVKLFHLSTDSPTSSQEFSRRTWQKHRRRILSSPCFNSTVYQGFINNLDTVVLLSLMLITVSVAVYFLVATVCCIRILKSNGFLQFLFRSGLSVGIYWTIVWIFTVVECLIFAFVYVQSFHWLCWEDFETSILQNIFFFFFCYCLSLAAAEILLELLMPTILTTALSIILACITFFLYFLLEIKIVENVPIIQYLIPPLRAKSHIVETLKSGSVLYRNIHYHDAASSSGSQSLMLLRIALTPTIIGLATIYLDFMLRGGNGLHLPYYFPLHPKFWWPRTKGKEAVVWADFFNKDSRPHIEPVLSSLPFVAVNDICVTGRSYCCKTKASRLKGLSCNFFRDEIAAIVGHNAAGKSTLLKVLSGNRYAQRGTVYIDGFESTDALERLSLRGRIAFCSQNEIACSALTVMQCIEALLISRGMNNATKEASKMMRKFELHGMKTTVSTVLNSAQSRKLSTIMALLGGSSVVCLDEPTAGMDPTSRRQLWQVLHEAKTGRSIIFSTLLLEDAEFISNRMIFLNEGEVLIAGSSLFLRNTLGSSFVLSVSFKSQTEASAPHNRLKEAQIKTNFRGEKTVLDIFPSSLKTLRDAANILTDFELQIRKFRLLQTSLDDSFTKLSCLDLEEIKVAIRAGRLAEIMNNMNLKLQVLSNSNAEQIQSELFNPFESFHASFCSQLLAMLAINLRRCLRRRSGIWGRFIFPGILLLAIGLTMFSKDKKFTPETIVDSSFTSLTFGSISSKAAKFNHRIACLHDGADFAAASDLCATSLKNSSLLSIGKHPLVLNKSSSVSMRRYLAQGGIADQSDTAACNGKDCELVVLYASSWKISDLNKRRSIAIAVVTNKHLANSNGNTAQLYRHYFNAMWRLFHPDRVLQAPTLAHIIPFHSYWPFRLEVVLFLILMCAVPATFLNDSIEDVNSRVRDQLAFMGISGWKYWMRIIFLHKLQYLFYLLLALALLCIGNLYRLFAIITLGLLLAMFGTLSNQLLVYTISSATHEPNAYVSLIYYLLSICLPPLLLLFCIVNSSIVLLAVGLLPPLAPVLLFYEQIRQVCYRRDFYHTVIDGKHEDPLFSMGHVLTLWSMIALIFHIISILLLFVVMEHKDACSDWFSRLLSRKKRAMKNNGNAKYIDTKREKGVGIEIDRLADVHRDNKNILEVRQLKKTYPNRIAAIRGLTFGAKTGEVLGILGASGAGKSTIMGVLSGSQTPTEGSCEVRTSITGDAWLSCREAASVGAIGYCPQYSPVFERITVREHLWFYAKMRGLPSDKQGQHLKQILQFFGLLDCQYQQAGTLSTGKKRLLCLAFALLGNPSLIIIDEPTLGVEQSMQRAIWNAIRGMTNEHRSVVVATESMKEAENLCSRIGILNNGRLVALGTVSKLLSRHGDGLTMEILLQPNGESSLNQTRAIVREAIENKFPDSELFEELTIHLHFLMPIRSITDLSQLLNWLINNKRKLKIGHCLLYRISPDQVFARLVKQFDGSVNNC